MVQNIPGNELELVYYDNHKLKKAVAVAGAILYGC